MPDRLALSALLLAMASTAAMAQSYADRNFSVQPPPRGPVILAPVQPTAPPPPANALPPSPTIGSYASDAPGADLRALNTDYVTPFPIIHRLPPGATIREVRWRYGVAAKPPGFEAVLCWKDARTCWVVGQASEGSTTFFNGRDAAQPMLLIYRVRNKDAHAALAPIKGAMNQVIVSFDVPR